VRLSPILLSIILVLMLAMPMVPTARATEPDEVVRVFGPTGIFYWSGGVVFGTGSQAKLDANPIALSASGGFAQTGGFSSTSYVNYWSPWENRSNFPPNPATVLSVSIIAIAHSQCARPFTMTMDFWNGVNWTHFTTGTYYTPTTNIPALYSYNVTQAMIDLGAFSAWNAAWLKESSNELTVSVVAWTPAAKALYIDYVGLDYIWTNATTAGGGEGESELNVANISVTGIMGIFGFVGMIAVPAASVWFYRRDGGSKIATAIIALVGFLVCFGMFFGVINGG